MLTEERDAAASVEFCPRRRQRLVECRVVDGIYSQRQMTVSGFEHVLPLLRRIWTEVAKLFTPGRHTLLKRQGKGVELSVRNAECLQTFKAQCRADPEIEIVGPVVCRGNVRRKATKKIPCTLGLIEVEHGVDADIRLGAASEDQCLDVIQLERDAVASKPLPDRLEKVHTQPTLSRNSLTACSIRCSRRTSTTVTCGLATNHPAAVI